ncbi:hypothetical protein L2E82_08533 [Cichorium intybus]|uniref:Uncharacterized protein n=1 Tax=Cichorium intybus TaxID=13427 RepID=A0ACB9G6C0_CICIN|nr:hypothetical protein L2E82_08533 [Cichorium intybus]
MVPSSCQASLSSLLSIYCSSILTTLSVHFSQFSNCKVHFYGRWFFASGNQEMQQTYKVRGFDAILVK